MANLLAPDSDDLVRSLSGQIRYGRDLNQVAHKPRLRCIKAGFDALSHTERHPIVDVMEATMAQRLLKPEIAADLVYRIILKARQFDAKEGVVESDYGGNAIDDGFREVLADFSDDPVYEELKTFIDDLDEDEQCELVALTWIGRGDFPPQEWNQALALAHQEHNARTAEYLLGTPLLADYLADGMAQFDMSREAEGRARP
jgi:hypothetical protein